MKVKVCGMREPRNIREIAELEPDFMGFIFYNKSPRFVGNLDPSSLDVLTAKTLRTGVFVNSPLDYILEQAEKYSLKVLQLHGNERPQFCFDLRKIYQVIKVFNIGDPSDLLSVRSYEGSCDYFLFDTKTALMGGSGKKFDHKLLSGLQSSTQWFLSGGIEPDDQGLFSKISHEGFYCVDINSRFETAPGLKDAKLVRQFMKNLKQPSNHQ